MPYQEKSRETPIIEETDVIVCGGGPAGVAASIASARTGAKTRLIETHGQLGGVWTTGMLSWILDSKNKPGLMGEIIQRIEGMGGRSQAYPKNSGGVGYDVEVMKLALEEMCFEEGVEIRLHTRVVAAARSEENRIAFAITESKSGREAWQAKCFIDCTGDGDLAAQVGCGFDIGRPAEGAGSEGRQRAGETQPFSLMCLIAGIDAEATSEYHDRTDRPWHVPKEALMAEFRRAGLESSYGKPTIFKIHKNLFAWMINHEYGFSGVDAQQITDATIRARSELHRLISGLRSLGEPWSDIRIVATGAQIGVREGRRIHGRYTVTLVDMLEGRRHEDAICEVTFGIDVHSTNKSHGTGIEGKPVKKKTQPYDIPLRALIASGVDGLLMAGRCISGDFLAHSSYRVTGNAVAMGQAAGVTAALAALSNRLPHQVGFQEVLPLISSLSV
ncbi:MAG: FAD-dependent oxidoreductase [Planctomycetota bacterium]|nr:FAD-dependent oxidoreductase [Planctomycetota bacterium]MDA1137773.1 FAD-dependent oxidoreductase [Planctomycetota bacterium]